MAMYYRPVVMFALLVVIGALYFGLDATTAPSTRGNLTQWTNRASVVGANEAYKEFTNEYRDAPFSTQHAAAHAIGNLLYDSVGLSGIAICDESFAFGCYHGFFGRVLSDKGTSIIPVLADSCREQYGKNSTGCEHGIGHGIMEYAGRENLSDALKLCAETKQSHELYGCTSGLFMEYNNAMMFRGGEAYTDMRPYDAKNPLAPCNTTVPAEYRTSCYFEIALWWKDNLGNDFENIGNMCAQADSQPEQDACYQGWGTVVAESVDHSPDEAERLCGLIHDSHGVAICALGAASRFFPAGYPQAGQQMCAKLPGPLASQCRSFSTPKTLL